MKRYMMRGAAVMAVWLLGLIPPASANNVSVTNTALVSPAGGKVAVQFDLSWENSWRDSTNYDACWLFVKYSLDGGTNWNHATLSASGTNPTDYSGGSGTSLDVVVPSDKKGAFLQRSATGSGSIANTGVKLLWDFQGDGVSASRQATVKVFAIEMVYIPQGAFWVGNTNGIINNSFRAQDNENSPIYISSTNAFTIYWGSTPGSASVPSSFPNGYEAFYMMKTEISQRQYCDFLNTLTTLQQGNRHYGSLYFNNYRNFIKKTADSPAFFGCDADNDAGTATSATRSLLNETNDGEWTACNYISWADGKAYADWAALRPFTELEFEKACRGPLEPVQNEYAWGNTNIGPATPSLSDAGTASETPANGNCNLSGCWGNGAYRSGCYATAASTRAEAGAGYYGALDLSGNLFERVVSVQDTEGRVFTGLHGDGSLTSDGKANVTGWPADDAKGAGRRGTSHVFDSTYARTADRKVSRYTGVYDASRYDWDRRGIGWRAARSAP